jgi:hypothetical protein
LINKQEEEEEGNHLKKRRRHTDSVDTKPDCLCHSHSRNCLNMVRNIVTNMVKNMDRMKSRGMSRDMQSRRHHHHMEDDSRHNRGMKNRAQRAVGQIGDIGAADSRPPHWVVDMTVDNRAFVGNSWCMAFADCPLSRRRGGAKGRGGEEEVKSRGTFFQES